ncbi:MAG: rhamnogalacturonan acetylesterase [Ignavibacteriaceae bacterium]
MKNLHNYFIYLLVFVSLLAIGASANKITVFTIGDSTMCLYDTTNAKHQRGWAQTLPQFFNSDVKIVDAARGGRSSKSFVKEGLWEKVINQVKPGDYVFIQFAHNDEKKDTAIGTQPWQQYSAYLKLYVEQTREKGGTPILFTPIVRRYFDSAGHITLRGQHDMLPGDSLGNYPMAMRYVAKEMNVPLIDLTTKTKQLVESYGPEKSKELYITTDKTHPTLLGATKIAWLAIEGLREQNIDLIKYLNPNYKLKEN